MGRRVVFGLVVMLVAVACGSDDPSSDTTAPSNDSKLAEMREMVLGPGGGPEGTELNPGEAGAVTIDLFPEGSELRAFFERHQAVEAFGAVFTSPDGDRTVVNAAIRFASPDNAAAAVEEAETGGPLSFLGTTGAILVSFRAQGFTSLFDCAEFILLEQTDDIVHVWVDTSRCVPDGDSPAYEIRLVCPEALAPGDQASVTVRSPQHFAPFQWEADADTMTWTVDGPIEVDGWVGGVEVVGSVTAGDVGEAEVQQAKVGVEFELIALLTLWETYRATGGFVVAECEIDIVGAEPVDVAGLWLFEISVMGSTGECDDQSTYTGEYTITQDGTSIEVTGLSGQDEAWTGSVAGDMLSFSGSRDDDGGVTSATFNMTVDGDSMVGTEDWSWAVNDVLRCPSGFSEVTAVRAG